jgi:hypothetical protein
VIGERNERRAAGATSCRRRLAASAGVANRPELPAAAKRLSRAGVCLSGATTRTGRPAGRRGEPHPEINNGPRGLKCRTRGMNFHKTGGHLVTRCPASRPRIRRRRARGRGAREGEQIRIQRGHSRSSLQYTAYSVCPSVVIIVTPGP